MDRTKNLFEVVDKAKSIIHKWLDYYLDDGNTNHPQYGKQSLDMLKEVIALLRKGIADNSGYWGFIVRDHAVCSVCGETIHTPFDTTEEAKEHWNELYPYCPHCGAKMEYRPPKIDSKHCKKESKIPVPKPSESLVGRVRAIVEEQLGVNSKQVTDDASFVDDLGADSLDLAEITISVEAEFGINFRTGHAPVLTTFGALVDYLAQKGY